MEIEAQKNKGVASPHPSVETTNRNEQPQVMGLRTQRANARSFWLFLSPLMIGLLVFTYIPILWGLILSFTRAQGTVLPTTFVGLDNYQSVLLDEDFQQSLITFLFFAAFIVPITFGLSLGLAVLVNSVRIGQSFFRSVFFLPTACSIVVASLIWRTTLFTGLPSGAMNAFLGNFGIHPIVWIGSANPPWYWVVLVSVRLWSGLGFNMILFLAGLQEIPRDLYEAATVDGAKSGRQTFQHITFPLLRNTSILVLLLNLINAFQAFDEFYNVLAIGSSGGGSGALIRPPLVYLYQIGFGFGDYGRGSAGAFILTAIIVLFTLVQGRILGFGRSSYE